VWIRVKEERYKGKSKIPLQEFFWERVGRVKGFYEKTLTFQRLFM
jgi:hypothetical protein